MTEARVDYENNAEEFWDAFREAMEALNDDSILYANCQAIIDDDVVELPNAEQVKEFVDFAAAIPGWNGGPEYAAHPIVFQHG